MPRHLLQAKLQDHRLPRAAAYVHAPDSDVHGRSCSSCTWMRFPTIRNGRCHQSQNNAWHRGSELAVLAMDIPLKLCTPLPDDAETMRRYPSDVPAGSCPARRLQAL